MSVCESGYRWKNDRQEDNEEIKLCKDCQYTECYFRKDGSNNRRG